MKNNTPYRIMKLKSGEEIIAKIVGSTKDKLKLERPMSFRFVLIQDYNGTPKEVVLAKNWSPLTDDNNIEIPKDFVVSFLTPNEEAILLYDSEKNKQDVKFHPTKTPKKLNETEFEKELEMLKEELDGDVEFKKMMQFLSEHTKRIENESDMVNSENPFEKPRTPKKEDMIFMNMMFPPEMLIELIESELIDPEIFGEMYKDIKKQIKKKTPGNPKKKPSKKDISEGSSGKYTGDQKEHKDYGNRWTDWNPNLDSEDYK